MVVEVRRPPIGPAPEQRSPRRAELARALMWAVPVALVAAAVLPYLATLDGFFIGDDFGLIWLFEKKRIAHFLTLFWSPWTENVYGIWADELRPTVAFSYWLDGRLFGSHNPFGFHLDNVVVHAACTLLVWGLARAVVRRETAAVTAGAVFAVTSIHPEAVTWISGRADLIPTLFYLGGLLAFVLFRQRRGAGWLILATAAYVLTLYSKQSGVTFLGMLIAYDLIYGTYRPLPGGKRLLGRLAPYLPFALGLVGYLALRRLLFGQALREDYLTIERLIAFLGRQSFYLQGVLFGGELERLAGPSPAWAEWAVLVAVASAALFGLFGLARRLPSARGAWRHGLFFGPVWYGICVVPLIVTYQSPRHLYMASAGGAVLLATLLWLPFPSGVARRGLAPAMLSLLLVVALGYRLSEANRDWIDAGILTGRASTGISRIAEELPPGSKVILLAPASYGTAWFWPWALPYALDRPFATGDLYGRFDVVEAPSVYCCPLPQWWAIRAPTVRRWLAEAPLFRATVIYWDGPAGQFAVDARVAPTAELRARIDAILGESVDTAAEVSEDQATSLVRVLHGP